jgi:osmotically-inducible protein OsmY
LLNGEDIGVRVNDGVVTLTGNVNEKYERTHADQVASRVTGVLDVVNLIQVNPPPKYTDAALERRIKDRLRHDAETRWVADQIRVHVHDGEAVLEGTVNFWSERDEAAHVAFRTDGISSVNNNIRVAG